MAAPLGKSLRCPIVCALAVLLATAGIAWKCTVAAQSTKAPIHFSFRPIPFSLDSSETPQRHAPETMAGGVAVFDYNNDGNLDIFFTNGADIVTLQKTSPKYWNRLVPKQRRRHVHRRDRTSRPRRNRLRRRRRHRRLRQRRLRRHLCRRRPSQHALPQQRQRNLSPTSPRKPDSRSPTRSTVRCGPSGAAWVDVNNDGLLDLFVVNYMSWDVEQRARLQVRRQTGILSSRSFTRRLPNQLFLNNGDGTFKDVSAKSGIRAHPGKGMGVGGRRLRWRRPARHIRRQRQALQFSLPQQRKWTALKKSRLRPELPCPNTGNVISGMGVDFRDLNNDGRPDIVLVGLDNETFPVYRNDGKAGIHGCHREERHGFAQQSHGGLQRRTSPISTTMDGRIFSSAAGTCNRQTWLGRQMIDQPNTVFRNLDGNEVVRAHRGGRFRGATCRAVTAAPPSATLITTESSTSW